MISLSRKFLYVCCSQVRLGYVMLMVMLIVMLWLCLCMVMVMFMLCLCYVYVYVYVMFMSCLRSCLLLWVRALAWRSGDHTEFKTRSDHWMYLAN